MKRWHIWTLAIGVFLSSSIGLLWVFRLEVLPLLIYLLGSGYGIDKVRYNLAEWDKLQEITFYGFRVEKHRWAVTADTLRVRFFPNWVCRASAGRVLLSEPSPLSLYETANPKPHPFALPSILHLRRLLNQMDTLYWEDLALPHGMRFSLHKRGDSCIVYVRRDTLFQSVFAYLHGDSVVFRCGRSSLAAQSGAFVKWDTLVGSLFIQNTKLSAEIHTKALRFYHWRLASRPLWYAAAGFRLAMNWMADTFEVKGELLDLPLRAYLSAKGALSDQAWELRLEIPKQPHEAYIRAFPEGFLTCINRADIAGISALSVMLRYDTRLTDTLLLEVDWQPERFSIRRWEGDRTPFTLQEAFVYQPHGSERRLNISPESPTFLSYNQITPYVLQAVLHSEDGLFFYHQGFQKAHFLKAMLENWRCRCFRRGAGTITMQLVRNLLLTREKTIARKVEEILLTAIIERFRLLSKQRIAELYLNIIEWGPEVYGLTEASRFYFGKEPHDLTIPEAIFLGMILPSPKAYRYFIDRQTGCVLPSFKAHFQKITHYLVQQNYLSPDSVETILPERVCLRSPAWTPPDSLSP